MLRAEVCKSKLDTGKLGRREEVIFGKKRKVKTKALPGV